MYEERIDIVQGTQGYIKRILKIRGCSDATIQEVMNKIEAIIEHSGKLGRLIQRDKDLKELHEMKMELIEYKRQARIY